MAQVKISQLPEFTGSTDNAWLILNNPAQNETYKIRTEILLISASSLSSFATLTGVSSSFAILSGNNVFTGINSFGSITASFVTASIVSSSFIGDGSGLYNIPTSSIVDLRLSQIVDGAVTASVNSATGFNLNSNATITGSLNLTQGITASAAKIGASTGALVVTNGIVSTVSPAISGSVLTANGSQWISAPPTPGGGGSVITTTASLDFGFVSGNEGNYAITYVTAAWASSGTKFFCSPSDVGTNDHDPVDATLEDITFSVLNVTGGVGFNVVAYAPRGTWGTYLVNILAV